MKRADIILRKYEKIYNQKGFHKPLDGLVSVIYEGVKQFS